MFFLLFMEFVVCCIGIGVVFFLEFFDEGVVLVVLFEVEEDLNFGVVGE